MFRDSILIRLVLVFLAAKFLMIPGYDSGNRAVRDSRFCAAKDCISLHARRNLPQRETFFKHFQF